MAELYNIGGAYYKDPSGSQRATADEQAAYLTSQAKANPNNTSMADMGWANSSGGWAAAPSSGTDPYRGYSTNYEDSKLKYINTGMPVIDTTWTGQGNIYKLPDGNTLKYDGSTSGLIAALNRYYGQGGWTDGKQPDIYPTLSTKPGSGQVPKSPGLYKDPNDGLTYGYTLDKSGNRVWGSAGNEWAYPADDNYGGEALTWKDALARAGAQINPTYNSMRDKTEAEAAATRELIPQLMAARYGMSGTKGGRVASQLTKATQSEGMAVNQIEGERQRGINELAQALMTQDQERIRQLLALQNQQEQNQIAWASLQAQQENAALDRKMAYDFRYMDELQFEKNYGLSKDELAYRMTSGDRDYQLALDELGLNKERFAWEKDPSNLDNVYKQAQISKLLSGGGGGSGGSGGRQPTQTEIINANKGSVYQGIIDEINAGSKYNDIAKLIQQNTPALATMGVDPEDALSYLDTIYNPELKAYEDYLAAGPAASLKDKVLGKISTWI